MEKKNAALVFLSAVLTVLAFPPWDFSFFLFFSFVPVYHLCLQQNSKKVAFLESFLLSFLISLGGFFWVAYVLHSFGRLPWAAAIVGLILFCMINQLPFVFLRLTFLKLKSVHSPLLKTSALRALSFATVYTFFDLLYPKLFTDTMGHGLYQDSWINQSADLLGAYFLTFCLFFTQASFYEFTVSLKNKTAVPKSLTFSSLSLILFLIFYSVYQKSSYPFGETKKFRWSIVQANIGGDEKLASEFGVVEANEKIHRKYMLLSESSFHTENPDFILWPETAYPSDFLHPERSYERAHVERMRDFSKTMPVTLLFGGYYEENQLDHNSFYMLHSDGKTQMYHKNILLMFGEYLPGYETFPKIRELFPEMAFFGKGVGPEVFSISSEKTKESLKISPIICYEALFPNYVAEGARLGSQAIVNVTNDSWFGNYGEPELHLALTTFRSIETKLPQIRSTNTGISAFINPFGEITKNTNVDEVTTLSEETEHAIHPPLTWFSRYPFGIWIFTGSLLLFLSFIHLSNRKTGQN